MSLMHGTNMKIALKLLCKFRDSSDCFAKNCEIPCGTTQMQYSEVSGRKSRDGIAFSL